MQRVVAAAGTFEVRLPPSTGELRELSLRAASFLRENRLSPDRIDALLLALEEAVTNVLMYAFDGLPTEKREVFVRMRATSEEFVVTVVDNGLAFDPTRAVPRTEGGDDGQRPGGWGIPLLRGLVDEVRYERIGERNQLELVVFA